MERIKIILATHVFISSAVSLWIKQAAKLQSYINTCKEIMYSHLFPPGLSPLGDHQFNYPVQYIFFQYFFYVEKNRVPIHNRTY